MHHELHLAPEHFGPQLKAVINSRLMDKVEGKPMGKHGYVISVTNVKEEDISQGIIEDDGSVSFDISYQAIMFRPFKNEVLDAKVGNVNEHGFFADVGPLQVFVSKHAMPDDHTFDEQAASWVSDDREVEIKKDSGVRLRVMNTDVLTNKIHAIGSIQTDFLGLIDTE